MIKQLLISLLFVTSCLAAPGNGPYPSGGGGSGTTYTGVLPIVVTGNQISISGVNTNLFGVYAVANNIVTPEPSINAADAFLTSGGFNNSAGIIYVGIGQWTVSNNVMHNTFGISPLLTIITGQSTNFFSSGIGQFVITNNSDYENFSINTSIPFATSNEWAAFGNTLLTTAVTNIYYRNIWSGVNGQGSIDVIYASGSQVYQTLEGCDLENSWDQIYNNNGGGLTLIRTKLVNAGPNTSGASAGEGHNVVWLKDNTVTNYIHAYFCQFIASNTNSLNFVNLLVNNKINWDIEHCVFNNTNFNNAPNGGTNITFQGFAGASSFKFIDNTGLNPGGLVISGNTLIIEDYWDINGVQYGNMLGGTNMLTTNLLTSVGAPVSAGQIGQSVQSLISQPSQVSMTTTIARNITSITLTPGSWDVDGTADVSNSALGYGGFKAGITTTSATIPTDGTEVWSSITTGATIPPREGLTIAKHHYDVTSNTTVYLTAVVTFTSGTVGGYGVLTATRTN